MESQLPYISNLQRFSLDDGPGIRTTVFFKGCPLRCAWCHNPECISPKPQTMFYPDRCIHCGMCDQGCYSGARVTCGREMTADDIFAQILLDAPVYGDTGGVTFSGGEPMLHPEILLELADRCHSVGIATAAETSLYLFPEEVFRKLDYVMADFKIWDEDAHKRYTGVSNRPIRDHFRKLDALGVPFLVRTPVIPGVNDTHEEIFAIRDFVASLRHAVDYELLPYHPLGLSKQAALSITQTRFEIPTKEHMEELRQDADLSGSDSGNPKKEN